MCGQNLAFGQGLDQDFKRCTGGGQNVKNVKPQERALFWFECQLFSSSQDKDVYRTAYWRVQRQWQKSVLRKISVSKKSVGFGRFAIRWVGTGGCEHPENVNKAMQWMFLPSPSTHMTVLFVFVIFFYLIIIYIYQRRARDDDEWVSDWLNWAGSLDGLVSLDINQACL